MDGQSEGQNHRPGLRVVYVVWFMQTPTGTTVYTGSVPA